MMSNERVLTCEEAVGFLAAYLDGELEGATPGEIEAHLTRCRSCYSRAEFERRMKAQLATLGRTDVRPEFTDRLRRLLNQFGTAADNRGS
jgi:anti-sigma factor RsiW